MGYGPLTELMGGYGNPWMVMPPVARDIADSRMADMRARALVSRARHERYRLYLCNRYGVRLRASAPSIHLLKATIHTEISPIVGSERQSEELVLSLLQDFEQDPLKIWESNIFGKSLHELVNEGLQNKLLHMPQEARARLQETLERVINEGCSGLICIIL